MKILVDIGHPAHVHFFKNAIWKLEADGHEVQITARDKEVALNLLDAYGFKYHNLGKNRKGLANKAIGMLKIDLELYNITRKFSPDVLTGIHSPYVAHVSKLLRIPSLIFTDTEHAKLANKLTFPFTTAICTPSCFKGDLGPKHIRYNGYHELAYLHPNYFTPDPSVLDELGLKEGERFIIMRFVAWDASHDVGHKGISMDMRRRFVSELEKYGRVLITSESELPVEFEPYRIKVAPEKIHDLLYYAAMYVGDGGTTASEAALLGTPAVFISTIVSGYLYDEENCGLVYVFSDPRTGEKEGLKRALELLKDNNLKDDARERRKELLNDKIDVTAFMVWFIENYPKSYEEMKENHEMQHRFK